ncbi:hypothetical protein [Okeania sp. SIO2B3]|nr:hypothetical protein [Okeania sp. SIO2B3]
MERFDEEKTNRLGEAIQDEKIFGTVSGKNSSIFDCLLVIKLS